MGKSMAGQFSDDDYFAEPNYDNLTDEELDELYYFGEIRSLARKKRAAQKPPIRKMNPKVFADSDDELWADLDFDLDGVDGRFDDD